MPVEVEVRNAINITGRGAVLIAFAKGKLPQVGQVTPAFAFEGGTPRALKIVRLEKLTAMEVGGVAIGLVFEKPPSVAELKRAMPVGSVLQLSDVSD